MFGVGIRQLRIVCQEKREAALFLKIISVCLPIIFYMILFLDNESVKLLTEEDGLIESLGACFFLFSSVFFLICFKIEKNYFYLFLGLLFLFGSLEEISWGQRILGYETPKFLQNYNLQKESNIHNLIWFSGQKTSFFKKYLSIDRLFSIFWFSYCVIIPILCYVNSKFAGFITRFRIPIVPVFLGVLFFMNHIFSKGLEFYFHGIIYLPHSIVEIKETNFAFLFFIISLFELIKIFNNKETTTQKLLIKTTQS